MELTKKEFIIKLEYNIKKNIKRIQQQEKLDEFDNGYVEAMRQVFVDIQFLDKKTIVL